MTHRPVCKTCEVEYMCAENGVNVIDYSEHGPQVIHEADEFECPSCHHVTIVGFGDSAYSRVGDDDFTTTLESAENLDIARTNYIDARVRGIHKSPLAISTEANLLEATQSLFEAASLIKEYGRGCPVCGGSQVDGDEGCRLCVPLFQMMRDADTIKGFANSILLIEDPFEGVR